MMQKDKDLKIKKIQLFFVFFGFGALIIALILSPNFVAKYISSDHQLDVSTIRLLTNFRILLAILGTVFILHKYIIYLLKLLTEFVQRTDSKINKYLSRLIHFKGLFFVLLTLVLCFLTLRFFSINADFPSGITESSEIYTDEGWYTTAAVRHYLTGQWYKEREVNTAIAAPVGHLIHRIAFSIFGMSSSTVRITISILFVLITLLSSLLVRWNWGNYAGLLTAAILALNFLCFAYSRLGTPYLIATSFVIAGLFMINGNTDQLSLLRVITASILASLGILTHATALVAAPLIALMIIKNGSNAKQKIMFLAISGIVIFSIVGGHRFITNLLFSEDYVLYNASTVGHMFTTVHDWVWNFEHKLLERLFSIGSGLVPISVTLTVIAFMTSHKFRKDNLFQLFLAYIVIYTGMLSVNSYSPLRYYLILLVPIAGIASIACFAVIEKLHEQKLTLLAIIPIILLLSTLWIEGSKIITYIYTPKHSFYRMTQDVENIIMHNEGEIKGVILFGDIADSVSLEIGTDARNALLINDDLKTKIDRIKPKYMIVHVSHIDEMAAELGGTVTELGAWDVFDNYYADGEQVRLYEVIWPQPGSN